MAAVVLVLGAAAVPLSGQERGHVIYLHGRIVQEQQSPRPVHPDHGPYELAEIAEAFRARGFVVSADIRPKGTTVSEGADAVVAQIRQLIAAGVPAQRITVVGASMGAAIASRAAARLQNRDVRFALLGPCLSRQLPAVAAEEKRIVTGRLLVIREESDVPAGDCPRWNGEEKEIVIHTGLGHGFLYRPMKEWLEPLVAWIETLPSVQLPPALDRVLRDYERAWTARDAAALAALFAEDGFVLASGKPPVRGRAAIRQAYAKSGGPLFLRALAYSTEGDTGYIIGGYRGAADAADDGKFILALRRDDGRWLIAADIDNANSRRQ